MAEKTYRKENESLMDKLRPKVYKWKLETLNKSKSKLMQHYPLTEDRIENLESFIEDSYSFAAKEFKSEYIQAAAKKQQLNNPQKQPPQNKWITLLEKRKADTFESFVHMIWHYILDEVIGKTVDHKSIEYQRFGSDMIDGCIWHGEQAIKKTIRMAPNGEKDFIEKVPTSKAKKVLAKRLIDERHTPRPKSVDKRCNEHKPDNEKINQPKAGIEACDKYSQNDQNEHVSSNAVNEMSVETETLCHESSSEKEHSQEETRINEQAPITDRASMISRGVECNLEEDITKFHRDVLSRIHNYESNMKRLQKDINKIERKLHQIKAGPQEDLHETDTINPAILIDETLTGIAKIAKCVQGEISNRKAKGPIIERLLTQVKSQENELKRVKAENMDVIERYQLEQNVHENELKRVKDENKYAIEEEQIAHKNAIQRYETSIAQHAEEIKKHHDHMTEMYEKFKQCESCNKLIQSESQK